MVLEKVNRVVVEGRCKGRTKWEVWLGMGTAGSGRAVDETDGGSNSSASSKGKGFGCVTKALLCGAGGNTYACKLELGKS